MSVKVYSYVLRVPQLGLLRVCTGGSDTLFLASWRIRTNSIHKFISCRLFGMRVERRMSGTTICCIPVPFELVVPCSDGCPPTDWSALAPPFLAAWYPLFCGKVSVASEETGHGCHVLDAIMDSKPKLTSSGGGSLLF